MDYLVIYKHHNNTSELYHYFVYVFFALAQFWNIPMEVLTGINGQEQHFILIHPDDDLRNRMVPAFRYSLTWDHTPMTCYYVGNAQGGPENSHDPRESVIEGYQSQYMTESLFSPDFEYTEFEMGGCFGGNS